MPRGGQERSRYKKKFDRCIEKVKERSGKKVNLYAVCNANIGKKTKRKKKNE